MMIRFDNLTSNNWTAMCMPMNEVLPATSRRGALYIGSWIASVDDELLASHDIRALVSLNDIGLTGEAAPKAGLALHRIAIHDSTAVDIRPYLDIACDFISEKLSRGENVLVHCQQGISRSASIVLAYLMREHALSYDDAFNLLKSKRSCVKPNVAFERTLREWKSERRQVIDMSDLGFPERAEPARRTSSMQKAY